MGTGILKQIHQGSSGQPECLDRIMTLDHTDTALALLVVSVEIKLILLCSIIYSLQYPYVLVSE